MFQGDMAELLNIQAENEAMMDGQVPDVSPMDSHRSHILEHRAVLADPDLRKDKALVKNVLDHIEAHLDALENTDPRLLGIIGEQPIPPLAAAAQGNPNMVPVNQEILPTPPPPPMPPQQMMQQGPPPPMQGMPGGPPQPNTSVLSKSTAPTVLAPQTGLPQAGQNVTGPGQVGAHLPNQPHPPAPFNHLPTDPRNAGPQ